MSTFKLTASTAVALVMCAGTAAAEAFSFGDIDGALDTQVTVGLGLRTQSPDCRLVGDPTVCGSRANTPATSLSDNGDLNYKAGQLFSAYLKGTSELVLRQRDSGLSLMVRGSYAVDPAARQTERTELGRAAERRIVSDLRLLDAWVSKKFSVGGAQGHVKLGNQVMNWGESLFMPGGINATNAIDIQKSLMPGSQIKEFVLPSPMLSVAMQVAEGWNVQAYYQFGWLPSRQPPPNSYWSVADGLGRGDRGIVTVAVGPTANANGTGLDAASLLRMAGATGRLSRAQVRELEDQILATGVTDPNGNLLLGGRFLGDRGPRGNGMFKNQGQFGFSTHYKPPSGSTDFGFYYLRYHDKTTVLNQVGDPGVSLGVDNYFSYRPNRDLFGVSANMPVGDLAFGTELSYRPREAIALTGCFVPGAAPNANNAPGTPGSSATLAAGETCPLWKDLQKLELHVTGLYTMTASSVPFVVKTLGAQQAMLMAELVGTKFLGFKSSFTRNIGSRTVTQLADAGYTTWLDGSGAPRPVGSSFSSGMTLDFNWTYDGTLIPGWQVTPEITYFRALSGYTPTAQANYLKGAQSINLAVNFMNNETPWQAGINYARFFGGSDPLAQPYRDRAFVGAYVTRHF